MLACVLTKKAFDKNIGQYTLLHNIKDILSDIKFPDNAPEKLIERYEKCVNNHFSDYTDIFQFYMQFAKYDPYIGFDIVDGIIQNKRVVMITPMPIEYSNMYKINQDSIHTFSYCLVDLKECLRVSDYNHSDVVISREWFKKYNIDWNNIELKWINIESQYDLTDWVISLPMENDI